MANIGAEPGSQDSRPGDVQHHEANLTRGMEHLRPYVSVAHAEDNQGLGGQLSQSGADVYGVPAAVINPIRRPVQRPSSPSNAQKRSDPFQFGSRFLEEGDDVFEFNAWDHVEVDEAFKDFAMEQYRRQREAPVNDFDKNRINSQPAKPWNRFYTNNSSNFFKNRKWLFQEFPVLADATGPPQVSADGTPTSNPVNILEIGAGAGNTAFPLLAANQNPDLHIDALDFSSSAVKVMRQDPSYDEKFVRADVWDLASAPALENGDPQPKRKLPSLPPNIRPGTIDIALLIFTLSALSPDQWEQALLNVWTLLKPGGQVLFRDYGRGDLAQVRFKKSRWLDENFYVRGDGTRVYFFDEEELKRLWQSAGRSIEASPTQSTQDVGAASNGVSAEASTSEAGASLSKPSFEVANLGVDRRMLVNRKRKLKMYRCWMQGRFRKPVA